MNMDVDADAREIEDLMYQMNKAKELLEKIKSDSLTRFRLDIENAKVFRNFNKCHFIDSFIAIEDAKQLLKSYINILKERIDKQRPKEKDVIRITIDETDSENTGLIIKPKDELLIIVKNTEGVVRKVVGIKKSDL